MGTFEATSEERGEGEGEKSIYVMHGERAQNRCEKEVIMEEKMRVLEGPGKIDQLRKKKKVAPHEQRNENGGLRDYSFSGASFEVDAWTLVRGPKRKSPRVQSL